MSRLTDDELIEELKFRCNENRNAVNELKRLNSQLIEVNKKLEESEALKSHFISNITNEIINPFTSIMGLARNILGVDKENWKRVISMVALIHSEAFNLDFQLRNIFVAAKIEAGEIEPEITRVDIDNLLDSVIDSFRLEARKKNLKLIYKNIHSVDNHLYFNTDPEKLKLILSNLLSNAIKFSYQEGNIDVIISKKEKELELIVKDYGTGISETNQTIIFERFKRLDSGINSLNRGHGLGLSINKALLDMLNGHIKIQSEINKGAEFVIKIPEKEVNVEGYAPEGNEFIFDADNIF